MRVQSDDLPAEFQQLFPHGLEQSGNLVELSVDVSANGLYSGLDGSGFGLQSLDLSPPSFTLLVHAGHLS
jgi:hypothetical protein